LFWVRQIRAKVRAIADPIAIGVAKNISRAGVTRIPDPILVIVGLGGVFLLRAVVHGDADAIAIIVTAHLIRTRITGVAETIPISIAQLEGRQIRAEIDGFIP
tara:strand:+ start:715 stop:1023 length:309 start_codon:yes stop_codon:yes gene_type:complete